MASSRWVGLALELTPGHVLHLFSAHMPHEGYNLAEREEAWISLQMAVEASASEDATKRHSFMVGADGNISPTPLAGSEVCGHDVHELD
eukprot:1705320-Amphidinium_carterae.1